MEAVCPLGDFAIYVTGPELCRVRGDARWEDLVTC